jgi:hypothetical protein
MLILGIGLAGMVGVGISRHFNILLYETSFYNSTFWIFWIEVFSNEKVFMRQPRSMCTIGQEQRCIVATKRVLWRTVNVFSKDVNT